MLKRLCNLNYEIHQIEMKAKDRIGLKLAVLRELQRYGLRETTDFKIYLDQNPATKLALNELEERRRRRGF